ncbi:MAG: hypothetical protein JWO21_629 [Solirubrobacterales bacterium]|nr:hypothetical protein [Solirubrobacterales bacterium]
MMETTNLGGAANEGHGCLCMLGGNSAIARTTRTRRATATLRDLDMAGAIRTGARVRGTGRDPRAHRGRIGRRQISPRPADIRLRPAVNRPVRCRTSADAPCQKASRRKVRERRAWRQRPRGAVLQARQDPFKHHATGAAEWIVLPVDSGQDRRRRQGRDQASVPCVCGRASASSVASSTSHAANSQAASSAATSATATATATVGRETR